MIGFIGCGNMGRAIIKGIIEKGLVSREKVIASAASDLTKKCISEELKINLASDNRETVEKADIIFFAVKPQILEKVISEIKDIDISGKTFVSMSPGKTFDWFNDRFGKPAALVRTAPNTALSIGEGMTAVCGNPLVAPARLDTITEIFSCLGLTVSVEEKLLDIVLALGGSSPAFAYMFIEALADGAVAEGMPRALAYKIAAQAVAGSGKMVLESGKNPAALKDEVASPGGTTIEGINTLEDSAFRSAAMNAVRSCIRKAESMK